MVKTESTFRGVLTENEPMSRHTSWRVGGVADRFYRPADIEDLSFFLKSLPENEAVFWLGLGSNLLVADKGIRGTVICTSGVLNNMQRLDNNQLYAEVGVASPKLARYTAKESLAGAEFLCGIPGTIGGALKMNAGALGGETWDIVSQVQTIDRRGELHVHDKEDFNIRYRHVEFKQQPSLDEWFVSTIMQLQQGNKEVSQKKIKAHLARRGATQPTQLPNAGSVFRNPQGDYAARLIESCGLKNYCIGGACVSEKHANFIINTGTATASDIRNLINEVREKVKQQHGVSLVQEVQFAGEEDE